VAAVELKNNELNIHKKCRTPLPNGLGGGGKAPTIATASTESEPVTRRHGQFYKFNSARQRLFILSFLSYNHILIYLDLTSPLAMSEEWDSKTVIGFKRQTAKVTKKDSELNGEHRLVYFTFPVHSQTSVASCMFHGRSTLPRSKLTFSQGPSHRCCGCD
jgi:hypothetical protein